MTEQQEKLFREDPFVKMCIENKASAELIGGAVIDILNQKLVKDYDISSGYHISLDKLNLDYQYDTKTSTTYKTKCGLVIQILKRAKSDFDFTISQSTLNISREGVLKLQVDGKSFDSKILIPTEIAWTDKASARNSLSRVIHWQNKGYGIHPKTYKSLRKVAKISIFDRVISFFSNSEES